MNIEPLIKENEYLREKIIELEDHLKRYTNSNGHKKYYEKNKDRVMQNASNYLKKLSEENPNKLKEYRRRAYQNRKQKLKEQLEQSISNAQVLPVTPTTPNMAST